MAPPAKKPCGKKPGRTITPLLRTVKGKRVDASQVAKIVETFQQSKPTSEPRTDQRPTPARVQMSTKVTILSILVRAPPIWTTPLLPARNSTDRRVPHVFRPPEVSVVRLGTRRGQQSLWRMTLVSSRGDANCAHRSCN